MSKAEKCNTSANRSLMHLCDNYDMMAARLPGQESNVSSRKCDWLITHESEAHSIEIINNTRGGIVMFIQAKKGNASNGGQKIQMLK